MALQSDRKAVPSVELNHDTNLNFQVCSIVCGKGIERWKFIRLLGQEEPDLIQPDLVAYETNVLASRNLKLLVPGFESRRTHTEMQSHKIKIK